MSETLRDVVNRVSSKIRVTKVTSTRSVKGRAGDTFTGFSAGWESVQDDYGGPGADLLSDDQEEEDRALQGMTMSEAVLASLILHLRTSLTALDAAFANGSIGEALYQDQKVAVKSRFGSLIELAAKRVENSNE